MYRFFARAFWTSAAAAFLAEAWLWDFLGAGLTRLVVFLPLQPLRTALQWVLAKTPPTFAFVLFAIPVLAILPFKFLGLALLAKGRVASGVCVFFLAKTIGLGVTAFVYQVCHDRLMLLAWFVRSRDWLLAARSWARRQVEPYVRLLRNVRKRLLAGSALRASPVLRRLLILRARARGWA